MTGYLRTLAAHQNSVFKKQKKNQDLDHKLVRLDFFVYKVIASAELCSYKFSDQKQTKMARHSSWGKITEHIVSALNN